MESCLFFPFSDYFVTPFLFQYIMDNSTKLELMGEREAETAVFLVKGGSNTGLSLEVVDGASEVQSSNLTAK